MPLFLFVVGAALPWAMAKRAEPGQPLGPTYWRIARRVAVLWILGIVVQQIRYDAGRAGVVQQHAPGDCGGLSGDFAGPAPFVAGRPVGAAGGLGAGLRRHVDVCPLSGASWRDVGTQRQFPPLDRPTGAGRLPPGPRASPGSSPASAFPPRCSWGRWPGNCSGRGCRPPGSSFPWWPIGLACAAAGWLWSYWLPLNRHLWTSSMILWAGGLSFLVLALFYAVLDVAEMRWWAFPFIVDRRQRLAGLRARLRALSAEPRGDVGGWSPDWPSPYVKLYAAVLEAGRSSG